MAKGGQSKNGEGGWEKASRWLRNINALGAIAIGGAAVGVESAILTGWAVLNAGQAGFFEMTRRWAKNRNMAPKIGKRTLKPA